jgi:hypothetical protein
MINNVTNITSVILSSNDVFRAFLQALEEGNNKITDVFRVGRRKCVFVTLHCGQCEALTVHLASPANTRSNETLFAP